MPDFTNREKFVIDRVINRTNTAEGSNVPPRQIGTDRVPSVSNINLVSSTLNGDGSTTFLLTFTEPISPTLVIDHYNVIAIAPTALVTSSAQVKHSPASIKVFGAANTLLNLSIQTVLANGLVSPL